MPGRVVFDTNVMVSGLLWRGKAYQCLLMARAGVVRAVYCPEMMAELSEKLRHKFGFSENRIHAVVHDVRRFAEQVKISGTLKVVAADPDDDKFIECAVVGKAEAIVSGDHHLLDLDEYEGIPLMSAAEFVDWIASRPASDKEGN
jgi:putative PIN family toxin of toxin-antitoxin system